jgi:energy-coupling factor transporter ATP-binding protein EcfA2
MSTILADYEREQRAFEALLEPNCRERILLLRGESGSGKTTLVNVCLKQMPGTVHCIPIQLRGSAVGVAEIFSRAGNCLNWERLPHLTEQVAALQGKPSVQVDGNWLAGINNRISVTLNVASLADRKQRRALLTDAWFRDLQAFSLPLLVALDTYEQANTEVAEWIAGPFLARVAESPPVRVLVAGQKVPDDNNIEWGRCCTLHELYGVPEAEHWLPVVEAMQRHIPFSDPLTWLAGVCHALKGDPREIMQVIQGLPRREGTA